MLIVVTFKERRVPDVAHFLTFFPFEEIYYQYAFALGPLNIII